MGCVGLQLSAVAMPVKPSPRPLAAKIYCIVPRDLADELHEPLRRFFRDRGEIEVIVERRRVAQALDDRGDEERRALTVLVDPPLLPRRAQRHSRRLLFVQRLEPARADEQIDTDELIAAFQDGEREVFTVLYLRYFDRVFRYMRVVLRDLHEAEDATQHVFMSAWQALNRYRIGGEVPFHAWLVRIARNHAIDQMRKSKRVVVAQPDQITIWREARSDAAASMTWTLEWISDDELMMLIERLPAMQRRVIALKYMLGFTTTEVAEALGQSQQSVRQMQSRAQRFLADRLTALGRQSAGGDAEPMIVILRQAPVLRTRRFSLGRTLGLALRE
jgi:RNA polymerase sigma-70 factor (ECF subfamily)